MALWRLGCNMFYSTTVDGKKEFLKKLCLEWNMVTLSVFLVLQFEFFLVLDLKGNLVYFVWKTYKIGKASCTNVDVGGNLVLLY